MLIPKIVSALVRLMPDSVGRLARKVVPVSAKRMLGRQAMRTMDERTEPVVANDGRKFHPITDRVFLNVAFSGDYEPDLSQVVRRIVKAGDRCVDVGANFGWYTTLLAKLVGPKGHVHCFEPSPRVAEILRKNISINGLSNQVQVTQAAVGRQAGELSLVTGNASDSGNAHLASRGEVGDTVVAVVALDEILADDFGNIAWLKIDVEGFEEPVLEGASQLLQCSPAPVLQIEVNSEALERAGSSRDAILGRLRALGYEFYAPRADGSIAICEDGSHSDLFCAAPGVFGDRLRAIVKHSVVTS